jgi:ubiquitin-protein ligase
LNALIVGIVTYVVSSLFYVGIMGMKDTPYESGVFKIEIQIPER